MLIVLTDGFNRFETASVLCFFSGLTPTIRQSVSRIKGRPRISKTGNSKLRTYYLCAVLQPASTTKHARQFMIEL